MKTKNQNEKNISNNGEDRVTETYWNGKTSDHPIIQEMIFRDNSEFRIHENKFSEWSE